MIITYTGPRTPQILTADELRRAIAHMAGIARVVSPGERPGWGLALEKLRKKLRTLEEGE